MSRLCPCYTSQEENFYGAHIFWLIINSQALSSGACFFIKDICACLYKILPSVMFLSHVLQE